MSEPQIMFWLIVASVAITVWVVVPAYVADEISKSKGIRDGWVWGLFLGWIGVLTVHVLPSNDAEASKPPAPAEPVNPFRRS